MSDKTTYDNITDKKTNQRVQQQESVFGVSPDDWEVSNLSNSRLFKSTSSGLETFSDSKIYIPTAGVEGGQVVDDDGYIRYDSRPSRANLELSINDVIFAKMKDSVKVLRASKELAEDYVFSTGFIRISPKFDLNSEFLKQVLVSSKFNQRKDSLAIGSTQPAIRLSDLSALNIPIPPLYEQRKIATVLYTVDRAIEKTETMIILLKRLHKGLFQSHIPEGIGHENFEDVRILGRKIQIPTSWDVTTVGEACSEIIDYRGKNPKFSKEGILHLRNINIGRGELLLDDLKYVSKETYDDWMTRGFPQQGDTLLSTEAPMGKTAVLPEMKFSLSQRLIVLRPGEQFDNQFFAHLMGSPFVQREYEARATGSTVKGISNNNLQEITIPIPPEEEQEEIAQRIDETLEAIHMNEQEVDRLKRLKRGLMQDLLSGEVRTHEKDIELVDSVLQHG